MIRALLVLPVAAALIAGCGGQEPAGNVPGPAAGAATATLVVGQRGVAPDRTKWYLRIETDQAGLVDERSFTGAISWEGALEPGRYRVVSWQRPCAGECPQSGDAGLGDLAQVCGAAVDLISGARSTATVAIAADGTCAVHPEAA